MEAKVLKLIIKWGNSKESSEKMVGENLESVLRMYPDAKPSKIAEVITYL